MTGRAKTGFPRSVAANTGGGLVSLLRTRTIVALFLLLLGLVAGIELARPGTVNARWISNMILFAAPLGIVAAGQTLVMLTGGIDLSVASVATASAYLMATHSGLGAAPAILYGLGVGFAPNGDPRRNPFDWEAWHECDVFRAQVETAMGVR